MFPMITVPSNMTEGRIIASASGASLLLNESSLVEPVIGSNAARNDRLNPVLLDGVILDCRPIDILARFIQELLILFKDGGSPSFRECIRCKSIDRIANAVQVVSALFLLLSRSRKRSTLLFF